MNEKRAEHELTRPDRSNLRKGNSERSGPIFAQALLKELSIKHGNVHDVAAPLGLKVYEVEAEGFDGALIRARNVPLGAIAVRASIREASRKNFTIAHEIGHFVLPGHENLSIACTATEVGDWAEGLAGKALEREANEFAAELLMPAKLVRAIVSRTKPSLAVIEKIAGEFSVSLSAAAWQYCEVASEACAVVWSADGAIQWVKRSSGFPFFLAINRPVQEGTFAAACFAGKKVPGRPRTVPTSSWSDAANLDSTVRLLEQSKALPTYRSVISMLWIESDKVELSGQ